MKIAFVAALAGGVVLLRSLPAAANGRFPQSDQIVFSPSDTNRIILRTTYGILPSHDNGATWGFICEDALGYSTATSLVDPPMAMTENNSLAIGGSPLAMGMNVSSGAGLSPSTDVGCDWRCIPGSIASQYIVDDAVRPDSPSSVVALTATPIAGDGAQYTYANEVYETKDNGVTWTQIGTPIDDTVNVTTIEVAKTDPNRIYVSGTRGYGTFQKAVLFVSLDKGQTWIEGDLPTAQYDLTMEEAIFIGAVDSTNADVLYLRSQAQGSGGLSRVTKVTISPDGEPTFTTAHTFVVDGGFDTIGQILGFALSPDGSEIYIGSVEQGLFVARTSDMVFQQRNSKIGIQCLAARQTAPGTTELWACSAAKYGFVAGVSTDDGKTFTPRLPLIVALTGAIACAPNPNGNACGQSVNSSQCSSVLQTFCQGEVCGIPDSGPTGGDDDGAPPPAPGKPSCSCDLAATRGGGVAGLVAALALAGVALKRRRK